MAQLASSRSLSSTFGVIAVLLLASGASMTACGGGDGGGDGDGDGDSAGSGGKNGMGGEGAQPGDGDGDGDGNGGVSSGDGDGDGSGGTGVIDPDANIGDTRLLPCGEDEKGLQAQRYTKTGWLNQTDCDLPFLSRWDTAQPGVSTEKQLKLPLVEEGTYNFWIDWGDDTLEHITAWDAGAATHTYPEAGEYDVTVVGTWVGFRFKEVDPTVSTLSENQDAAKLLDISQWGVLSFGLVTGHFWGAENFELTATDAPDLSHTKSLLRSFQDAAKFNADIGHWDISSVTNLYFTFYGTTAFNGDVGSWDTSNVTNMFGTFQLAAAFNQDIGDWDTSNVTDMGQMFLDAAAFNQDIGGWDTSEVESFRGTFNGATAFNADISGWDTSVATTMHKMFYFAESFDQNISGWDVSQVTDMTQMFSVASSFDQPIGTWNVSKVELMIGMFSGASSFDRNLGTWKIPNVSDMTGMFNFSGLSPDNYSSFLNSCALQAAKGEVQQAVPLGAVAVKYLGSAELSRTTLTDPPNNWVITDDGVAP